MSDPTAEIRATAGDNTTLDALAARYVKLCHLRDAANKKLAAVQKKLDEANARCETARREAMEHAAAIQDMRGGGEKWLALKKEIGTLARLLGGR